MYIRQIFLIQMKYRLQSMYNHLVGRAASVVSPFYFLFPGDSPYSLTVSAIFLESQEGINIIGVLLKTF